MSAAVSVAPREWQLVFRHPLLASLDARARSELESAGEIMRLRAGTTLFSAGQPADALFVIVSGEVVLRSGSRTRELRRVKLGDVLGEEAAARAHATRRHDAIAMNDVEVAVVPAALLRRVMARGETAEASIRMQRWLVRALASDTLERADFSRDLSVRERELLLDAGRAVELRRGEILHREGEASTEVYFVGEGIVQLASGAEKRVLAYHKSGDFFGDEALESHPHEATASAVSDAWIFAVRADIARQVAATHPDVLARALRVQNTSRARQKQIRESATRHVLADLHRFETSRSLLAIDQERCIRCGACAWSCSAVHEDGISRLLRRGDMVVATVRGQARTLLFPSSCQHCRNPACMIDCPTGAITRDAQGEVRIREELCTGCGSCAKACPWDNIQMAPRGRRLPIVHTETSVIAVKCDLCSERGGEPACVAACPAESIARIEPSVHLDDVAAVLDRSTDPSHRPPALSPALSPALWPAHRSLVVSAAVAGAALVAAGAAMSESAVSRSASGVALLGLVVLLFGYAAVKRLLVRVRGRAAPFVRARPQFVAHLAIGTASLGVAFAHAHGPTPLAFAFWAAALLGVLAAVFSKAIPPRLARIERSALLPEEIHEALEALDARVYRELSGRSDLLKGLYERVVRPYSGSLLALASICALGTPQRALREKLGVRLRALVGTEDERLDGLDALVSTAVERQSLRAQRLLTMLLRVTSFAHVIAAAALALLVTVHVFAQVTGR